jgi:hypothetical protein
MSEVFTSISQRFIIEEKIQSIASQDFLSINEHHKSIHILLQNRIQIARLYCDEKDNEKKVNYFHAFMYENEKIKQFYNII